MREVDSDMKVILFLWFLFFLAQPLPAIMLIALCWIFDKID